MPLDPITAKHAEEIKDFLSQAGLAYAFEEATNKTKMSVGFSS